MNAIQKIHLLSGKWHQNQFTSEMIKLDQDSKHWETMNVPSQIDGDQSPLVRCFIVSSNSFNTLCRLLVHLRRFVALCLCRDVFAAIPDESSVFHDSTMNETVSLPRKKLWVSETANQGRVRCLRTKANSSGSGAEGGAIPAEQDAKSCGTTCQNQTPQRWPHDEIVDRHRHSHEPRWGPGPAERSQRHLECVTTSQQTLANNAWGSHSTSGSSDDEEEPGRHLVKGRHTEDWRRGPKGAPASTSGWLWRRSRGLRCWRCCAAAPTTVARYSGHLERFLRWTDDEGRELREGDVVDSALVEFLNHRFLQGLQLAKAKGYLQPCSSFGENLVAVEGESSLVHEGAWKDGGASPLWKAASRTHSWRGRRWQQILGVRVSRRWRSTSWSASRRSEGPRLTRINVLSPVAGVSRILEPNATPRGGSTKVKCRDSRRLDLDGRSLPRELDWTGAEAFHRWPPKRALFRIQLHGLSGTVPHQSTAPWTGRFGALSNETLRGVKSIWTDSGASKRHANAEVGDNIRPWLGNTKNMPDCKTRPATVSLYFPHLVGFLRVARDHFVDAIWNRAKIDLCLRSREKPLRCPAALWWASFGRACRLMGFAARSWDWTSAWRASTTPVTPCDG